jgi:hypothetical protein
VEKWVNQVIKKWMLYQPVPLNVHGHSADEKDVFEHLLVTTVLGLLLEDIIFISGDLNSHVEMAAQGMGNGVRRVDGERLLEFIDRCWMEESGSSAKESQEEACSKTELREEAVLPFIDLENAQDRE